MLTQRSRSDLAAPNPLGMQPKIADSKTSPAVTASSGGTLD